MSAPPFFTALGPGANPTWQRSTDSGTTYTPNPSLPTAQINGGPTGQDRFRTSFTIDPGYSGAMQVTASGDIFDNTTNRAAILFYDGVALGFVIDPTIVGNNSLFGPRTFNIPVVPGVHVLEMWIGQGGNPGNTNPAISGSFTQSTLSNPCDCCPLGIARCYLNENDNSIGSVVLVDCAGILKWVDTSTEAIIAAPKFCVQTPSNLTLNGALLLQGAFGQQQAYSALSSPPSSTDTIQSSPGVYVSSASTGVAPCFGAHFVDMTWTQRMKFLQLDIGANPTGGGSGSIPSKFTSVATGPIGFNFQNVRLQVGQSILSGALADGSYARLTYVKNSTGAPIPGASNEPWINPSVCGFTQPVYVHDSTVTVDRFTLKLDFFKP